MAWIPQYIRNFVRYAAGHVITADEYNGDLNLLISQGDNNTEGIEDLYETKVDKSESVERSEVILIDSDGMFYVLRD